MKPRSQFVSLLLFTLLSGVLCFAGSPAPKISEPGSAELSELSKLRLLSAYQKALLTQVPFQQAKEALDKAVAAFNEAAAVAVKENKLPDGTTFQVDINAQDVKIVPPPPKPAEAPKPEEPKK